MIGAEGVRDWDGDALFLYEATQTFLWCERGDILHSLQCKMERQAAATSVCCLRLRLLLLRRRRRRPAAAAVGIFSEDQRAVPSF
jgi:hypothetical protein